MSLNQSTNLSSILDRWRIRKEEHQIFKKKYPRKPIIGGTFDIFVIFIIKGYYEKIRRHRKVL